MNWDPAEHPRGPGGEFIELYHGTSDAKGASIEAHGLTAERYSHYNRVLTARKDEAGYFSSLGGGNGAVVTVRVPRDKAAEYLDMQPDGKLASLKKPLPASMIHKVEYIGGARRGLDWDPAGLDVLRAVAWNPAKHPRIPGGKGGGEFTRSPASLGVPAPLDPGHVSMDGVPDSSPLWDRLNARLAAPQISPRGAAKGQVQRPAVRGGYRQAVGKVADAIGAQIARQGTMDAGRAWYPAEHDRAVARARTFGVTPAQAAAVEAATSPRVAYEINQRVTDEILDAVPKLRGRPEAWKLVGGGVLGANRDMAVKAALGEDIDRTLSGVKRRSFFDNIMFPGQTDAVTVDTWMMDALAQGLGMTTEQAQYLGREHPAGFPDGIGYMMAADAAREAGRRAGVPADVAQAAYWLARQQELGLLQAGQRGRAGGGRGRGHE